MNATSLPDKPKARNRLGHYESENQPEATTAGNPVERLTSSKLSSSIVQASPSDSSGPSSGVYSPYPTPSPRSVASAPENGRCDNIQGPNTNNSNSSLVELSSSIGGRGANDSTTCNPPPLIASEDAFSCSEASDSQLSLQNTTKLCHVGPSGPIPDPPRLIPFLNPPGGAGGDGSNDLPYMKPDPGQVESPVHDLTSGDHRLHQHHEQQLLYGLSGKHVITIMQPPNSWMSSIPPGHIGPGV